jgi:hypothetical protein
MAHLSVHWEPIQVYSRQTDDLFFTSYCLYPKGVFYLFLYQLSTDIISQLGDKFQDFYRRAYRTAASAAILSHCKRELVHAIWLHLLDGELMEAYEHGFICQFADGTFRRVFIRFLAHAADYPEKYVPLFVTHVFFLFTYHSRVLYACIRHLGTNPCPRCLVAKPDISKMGQKNDLQYRVNHVRIDDNLRRSKVDRVRRWIYQNGGAITSKQIKTLLGPGSLVPTRVSTSVPSDMIF